MGYALIQRYPVFQRTIQQLQISLNVLPNPPDFNIEGQFSIGLRL